MHVGRCDWRVAHRASKVAGEFDVILLQELPGQWADPMTPEDVKKLLCVVSPLIEAFW